MSILKTEKELIKEVVEVSKMAGKSILGIYDNPNIEFKLKNDSSPLTKADIASHQIIVDSLKKIDSSVPILSEEDSDIPFDIRSKWNQYWLIDPLDGTKEFINRNGEFTVNIALIENNQPALGVIHAPALRKTYWGSAEKGSYSQKENLEKNIIKVNKNQGNTTRVLASRSHPSPELDQWLDTLEKYEMLFMGSSLKFCLLASGEAQLYPRFGPTCEWDIAAGDAILRFAGGSILSLDGEKIEYGKKESYINPYFIASA